MTNYHNDVEIELLLFFTDLAIKKKKKNIETVGSTQTMLFGTKHNHDWIIVRIVANRMCVRMI